MNPLVSCVAETRSDWVEMVTLLANSVRQFGGSIATAPFVANFVGAIPPSAERDLRALDVTIRIVERFDTRSAWMNKLRMLQLSESFEFDVLVALDCDTAVMGDPSAFFDAAAICAKPRSWMRTFSLEQGHVIIERFLLDPVKNTDPDTGAPSLPYYSSGVLFVPADECRPLLDHWTSAASGVLGLIDELPFFVTRRGFADQVALAVALQTGAFRTRRLPVNLNCVTGAHPLVIESEVPVILHYRRNFDRSGFVRRSTNAAVNHHIDAFNRERSRVLGVPYTGLGHRSLTKWMLQDSRWRKRLWTSASAVKRRLA
jgi:hypothetical protein